MKVARANTLNGKKKLGMGIPFTIGMLLLVAQAFFMYTYVGSFCNNSNDLVVEVPNDKLETAKVVPVTVTTPNLQTRKSQRISDDPFFETVDCKSLLNDFRMKNIPKMVDNLYQQSFITTSREEEFPFYVATHSGEIDPVRGSLFAVGAYYEKKLTQIIRETFQALSDKDGKKPIMLDVGGNIGWFSLVGANYGAQVYYFEPNIVNNVRFCESQMLNGWVDEDGEPRVLQFMKGVGDEHAIERTFYSGGNTGDKAEGNPGRFTFNKPNFNALQKGLRKEVGSLKLITLDALAEDQGWLTNDASQAPTIAFMKVDVEGFEPNVFKGAKKLLNSGLVKNIELELKFGRGEDNVREITKLLHEAGYELHMHGKYKGPAKKLKKPYDSWEQLADDIMAKNLDENCWFKLR